MASGEVLTDLEHFTTWKDGARFHAADFNFWGVTFSRDSNMFYASLGTKGTTYLVRGDPGCASSRCCTRTWSVRRSLPTTG
jgi:hypothetical protein